MELLLMKFLAWLNSILALFFPVNTGAGAQQVVMSAVQGPVVVASFEKSIAPFWDYGKTAPVLSEEHVTHGHRSLKWTESYIAWKGGQNWKGADFLLIDFFNSSNRTLSIQLEIKDSQSKDYWTRVNYGITLSPGASTARIPTQLFVGELSRPGRALDYSSIVSFILARGEADNGIAVFVDNIRLEKTNAPDSTGIWAFDFGPAGSPLFPGTRSVGPETRYNSSLGYGFLENARFWRPYKEASNVLIPDSLYQDSVLVETAEFQLDLPNGEYKVWMNIDHPGGFWGEYPYYRKRRVWAQSELKVDDQMTQESTLQGAFQFQDSEDDPEESFFEKYYSRIFREKEFDALVTNGRLVLRLEGENCGEVPCFGFALSALVVFPKAQAAKGRTYLDFIHAQRKKEFESNFRVVKATGGAATQSVDSAAPRDLVELYFPQKSQVIAPIPDATLRALKGVGNAGVTAWGVAGESEILNFAVTSSEDLTLAEVSMTPLEGPGFKIPPQNLSVQYLDTRLSRVSFDGRLSTVAERYVVPVAPGSGIGLRKNRVRRFWNELKVPKEAPAGVYRGRFELRLSNSERRQVPIEFRVFRLPLEKITFPVGPFNSTIQETYWIPRESVPRRNKLQDESLRVMSEAGLTAFTFSPELTVQNLRMGKLGTTYADQIFKRARSLGFQRLAAYNAVFADFDLCRGMPPKTGPGDFAGETEEDLLARVGEAVEKHAREADWLPLSVLVCDEVLPDEFDRLEKRLSALNRRAGKRVQFTTTLSFGGIHENQAISLARKANGPFINLFEEPALKRFGAPERPWVYYNYGSRSTFGFYLYGLVAKWKPQMRLTWVWNQSLGNPYFALDSREDDYGWCTSRLDATLRCTAYFDRVVREGTKDYRFAQALEKAVKQNVSRPAGAEGRRLLDRVLRFERGPEPRPGESNPADFEAEKLRFEIAEWLEKVSPNAVYR